jgi:hypothetical protein
MITESVKVTAADEGSVYIKKLPFAPAWVIFLAG